jgi:TPR repeat protein
MRMSLRLTIPLGLSIVYLAAPALASTQVQTFTATHTCIMGEHDSQDDVRQRCLLEAQRKILEQAGVYIANASEGNTFCLTTDTITSFAVAVMQVQDTKEDVGVQQGHIALTLKLTAHVNLAEVGKQLAARQVEAAAEKERLKHLEAHLEAMQQQAQQVPGRTPSPPTGDISAADVQTLNTQAAQGNASAQYEIGWLYAMGLGVPKDKAMAQHWWERAAALGDVRTQVALGVLYRDRQDYGQAAQWFEKAAAQGEAYAQLNLGGLHESGHGIQQDYVHSYMWYSLAARGEPEYGHYINQKLERLQRTMPPAQIIEAQKLVREWKPKTP